MRILMIEDDIALCDSLKYQLEHEGYSVDICHDGEDGLHMIEQQSSDVVLLDRMLPQMDGISILKKVRRSGITTPILMVTALGDLDDRITGLDSGADDYIVKPFEFQELMARIRCIVRRPVRIEDPLCLTAGDLTYHVASRELSCGGKTLLLSRREGALMELFLRNPGQTLPRALILSKVWGPEAEIEDGNLDNYIYFMRRRLNTLKCRPVLKTIRGLGYCLEEPHV